MSTFLEVTMGNQEIKKGFTRVSDLLRPWNDFSHIPSHILERKKEIGTNVHDRISAEEEGFFLSLTQEEEGYYESYKKWREKEEGVVLSVEKRFYWEEKKLTGCVDAIFENEKEIFLVDYKTSAAPHIKTWSLQAGFYYMLAQQNDIPCSSSFFFINLKKDGKFPLVKKIIVDSYILKVCDALLTAHQYFNG